MNELIKKGLFFVPVVIVIGLFLFITRDDSTSDQEDELQELLFTEDEGRAADATVSEMEVIVDVKGEVIDPGVYEMPVDSRVNDVIQKAGGFTDEAAETRVNLAQKVHDEMIIIISKTGEGAEMADGEIEATGKVRINVADQTEIESLNGIGPSKAQAIIQFREENGLFQSAEDLLDISGIGPKTLDHIKDDLIVP